MGRYCFHDYDEPIACGIYYLGVRIVVDTLIRCGYLSSIEHNTSLLSAIEPKSHVYNIRAF